MVVISLPPPHQQLQPQNMLVRTGLIELTEPSETLKYKSFFKHCILQTILDVLYCLHLCGTKSFALKNELYSMFLRFGLGWHLMLHY